MGYLSGERQVAEAEELEFGEVSELSRYLSVEWVYVEFYRGNPLRCSCDLDSVPFRDAQFPVPVELGYLGLVLVWLSEGWCSHRLIQGCSELRVLPGCSRRRGSNPGMRLGRAWAAVASAGVWLWA